MSYLHLPPFFNQRSKSCDFVHAFQGNFLAKLNDYSQSFCACLSLHSRPLWRPAYRVSHRNLFLFPLQWRLLTTAPCRPVTYVALAEHTAGCKLDPKIQSGCRYNDRNPWRPHTMLIRASEFWCLLQKSVIFVSNTRKYSIDNSKRKLNIMIRKSVN